MIYKCILVKSLTYAQKAADILSRKGISAYITRQTFNPKYGCARCIKVLQKDLASAKQIMDDANIPMTGDVYDFE